MVSKFTSWRERSATSVVLLQCHEVRESHRSSVCVVRAEWSSGSLEGVWVLCSFSSLATDPKATHKHIHTHTFNIQTKHTHTLSYSTHVQIDPFNLLTYWSRLGSFMYLFIYWWDLSLAYSFCFLCLHSLFPDLKKKTQRPKKKKKKTTTPCQITSTTALYTVSLI